MADLNIIAQDLSRLEGKVALITGGSSGIGLAAAKLFRQRGATVVIGDLRPPKEALEGISYQVTDVTQWKSLVSLFDYCVKQHGQLDIVFANAGVGGSENTFADVLGEDGLLLEPKYLVVQVNLIGLLNTVKLSIHHMRKQNSGGAIVVTASKSGYSSPLGGPIYASTKHGVIGMMRALRRFLPPLNIRLNCIAPGFTDTGMVPEAGVARLRQLGVIVQPSETVALAALFLSTRDDYHARTIQVTNNEFREIEAGYEAASELMFGDKAGGRSSLTPEALAAVNEIFTTTI